MRKILEGCRSCRKLRQSEYEQGSLTLSLSLSLYQNFRAFSRKIWDQKKMERWCHVEAKKFLFTVVEGASVVRLLRSGFVGYPEPMLVDIDSGVLAVVSRGGLC